MAQSFISWRQVVLGIAVLSLPLNNCLLLDSSTRIAAAFAQSPDSADVSEPTSTEDFDRAVDDLRTTLKKLKRTEIKFYHSPALESEEWREQWHETADLATQAAADVASLAVDLLHQPMPNEQVIAICQHQLIELLEQRQLSRAYDISSRLVELKPDSPEFNILHAQAALLTNHFEEAEASLEIGNIYLKEIPDGDQALFRQLASLKKAFAKEKNLRSSERGLPRVEMETTAGKIVIELFENQAPRTTAHFIELIEEGFYDNILFHFVVKNELQMAVAQAGRLTLHGQRLKNIQVDDEQHLPEARKHFRGMVAMAKLPGVPNSASTQFYITFVPLPDLNGHHTIFGRVVSDMEIVDQLTATIKVSEKGEQEPIADAEPDRILSARVLPSDETADSAAAVEND